MVGFDDIPLASYAQPPLTTVAQPTSTMGERAVEMVLALIADGRHATADVSNVLVRGQLVVRESSGTLKAL